MRHNRWAMVVLWMFVIFLFSHQDASMSLESSDFLSDIVKTLVINIREDQFIEQWIIEHIRELAHIGVFMILGGLLLHALNHHHDSEQYTYTSVIGISYAIIDEIHQSFIPGRAFQLTDIALDTLGVGLAIFGLIVMKHFMKKETKNDTTTT
ncbi:MAG: VanZ family protein [Candidatus Izemoplasma sp.]|nr:VanZ family protein [Candidatus Izemoplasma sp.]